MPRPVRTLLLEAANFAAAIWSGIECCSTLPVSPLTRLGASALSAIWSSISSAMGRSSALFLVLPLNVAPPHAPALPAGRRRHGRSRRLPGRLIRGGGVVRRDRGRRGRRLGGGGW